MLCCSRGFRVYRKEGVRLASRHHSLDLSEVKDVIEVLEAFEGQNNCSVAIAFSVCPDRRTPHLAVTVTAFESLPGVPGGKPLGSVNIDTFGMNLRYLKDVVTQSLYVLDFELALIEWDSEKPKGA